MNSGNIKHGLEVLRGNVKIAPEKPGVYRMLGEDDKVLYVGKAKNIKKRITAYTHFDKLPVRLQRMVAEVKRMEFIIVENEAKALLMENELIKKLEPKYNILLKDDKTFPYLMIDTASDFPRLSKFRGKRSDKNRYFGPFANAGAVNYVLDILQKAFLLRSCRDGVFNNRQRPCLLYQIKRCSAPCCGKISRALTNVQSGNKVEYGNLRSADVIALSRRNDFVCIEVFFIRSGQNCGNVAYFPKQVSGDGDAEILEAFLGSFYAVHIVPKEIMVAQLPSNRDFLQEALGVKINHYQKGDKARIIQNVQNNAEAALDRKIAESASVKSNLEEFQRIFGLPRLPQRIEIYDNSHTQGSYALGAMVVATPEGFDKKQYRIFNIKNQDITNDDFAMMKEVLARRFARLSEDNKPDVILLDGGLGQLHAVHESLREYDLEGIAVIAISKGPERNAGKEFYHMLGKDSFMLPFQSPIAFYLQNLRDEAHRFAIGSHRRRRAKSVSKSRLDDIEGIGASRKRDLLNYFGSAEAVAQARLEDLQKVGGISKKTAEKIYNYFHD